MTQPRLLGVMPRPRHAGMTRFRSGLNALSLVCLTALMSACVRGTDQPPDPCAGVAKYHACQWDRQSFRPDHPCRLLLLSETESILGVPLSAIPGSSDQKGLCFNSTEADGDFEYTYMTGTDAERRFAEATRDLRDEVGDLGARAFWDGRTRTLFVSSGDGYLSIEMPTISRARGVAIRLARLALTRV